MPTPSDSTDELSQQIEQPLLVACPPEVDRTTEWSAQLLNHLGIATSDATVNDAAVIQEKPVQIEDGRQKTTKLADSSGKGRDEDQCVFMDVTESPLPLLSASLHSSLEDREARFVRPSAPKSSAIDLQWSSRFGIDSHRVGNMRRPCEK